MKTMIIQAAKLFISRAEMKMHLLGKQRLYAQAVKDGITSKSLLESIESDIRQLTLNLYGKSSSNA